MKVGMIVGSIRDGRLGIHVGHWLEQQAAEFVKNTDSDVTFELLDLKEFNVPLKTTSVIPGNANKQYDDENVQRWSEAIDDCDGYIFITPEYNHGVPAPLKNAFDSLASEWRNKVISFVSYGAAGGVRAVEQWHQIVANFEMFQVRSEVNFQTFREVIDGKLQPLDRRPAEAQQLFTDVERMLELTQR